MKKQLLVALMLTITLSLLNVNCSGNNNDDNSIQQNNSTTTQYFHPPTWIQGTWGVTNGTTSSKLYKFTADDFILMPDTSNQSMTGAIKAHPYGGSVDEISNTSTLYIFDVKYNNSGVTQHFEFKKISATQIQLKDNSNNTWTDLVKM
ncbi:hypothetical protein [Chryseobacterium indoltheticum]|uniref:Lipoprotein n=1 Tax=Chryseobacterium indoltheticum TaxID=254 RepID=A0A381FRS9_9FLAO|nr:hypothetical protein [Chryseobacterium indoltheticum]SUX48881.1 Uncharacterised protein [Chryseobacterium indoltheticum]